MAEVRRRVLRPRSDQALQTGDTKAATEQERGRTPISWVTHNGKLGRCWEPEKADTTGTHREPRARGPWQSERGEAKGSVDVLTALVMGRRWPPSPRPAPVDVPVRESTD